VFNEPLEKIIGDFKAAGLGSIPGGGGEILVDRVRQRISPLKAMSSDWLEVMDVAHRLGLYSSATMMFGHVETIEDRIEHLDRLRQQQDKSLSYGKGHFTAFICWTFQAENTKLKAPTVGAHDYLRTQALGRIYLDNFENIQSSWVTQGLEIGQVALKYGANDLGSIMIEENVVSQAGTCLDFTAIDPALVEFDRRTTGIDQFKELAYAAHERGGRVFIDVVINHTGWGAKLQEDHPEWYLRGPDGKFVSPGAWGVTWEDLAELEHRYPELWMHLAEMFLTWCRRGVDGFRCDAGYKVPLAAWQYIISTVRQEFPNTVFLLEGLGGPWDVTEQLLTEGGMQWALLRTLPELLRTRGLGLPGLLPSAE
jgi:hypothetical protein